MKNKSPLVIIQIELGNMANFNYIIADKTSGQALLIDPVEDSRMLLQKAKENNLSIRGILLTHGHFDHTGGVRSLTGNLGIPAYLSRYEAPFYIPDCANLIKTDNKSRIPLGSLSVECQHTPGHTPGCQCFYIEENLFTGDTLFVDEAGRTDFPGGNAAELLKSLQKIRALPDGTMIWPGHNYGSIPYATLGTLKTTNPFLAAQYINDRSSQTRKSV